MPVTKYAWDPIEDNITAEFDEQGAEIARYTTEPDLYGNVISQTRNGETSFFHHDAIGNTTELTDQDGTVTDAREYSAFGEVTESSGTTVFPFQFVGRKSYYLSPETGDYWVRRRVYNTSLHRWLSVDPLGVSVDDMNPFTYVHNRPSVLFDPSGLACCCEKIEVYKPEEMHFKRPHYARSQEGGYVSGQFTNSDGDLIDQYFLYFGFQVRVTVKGSINDCTYEQTVSRIANWKNRDKRHAKIPIVFEGDDTPSALSVRPLKSHPPHVWVVNATTLEWEDAPGIHGITSRNFPAYYNARFTQTCVGSDDAKLSVTWSFQHYLSVAPKKLSVSLKPPNDSSNDTLPVQASANCC